MRFVPITRLLLLTLLLWSGWACTDTLLEVVDISVLVVDPETASLSPGQSLQLSARLTDDEGNILTGRSVQWSSEASGIATVSATGMLLGVSEGTTTITASSGSAQGTAEVTVSAPPAIVATPDSVPLAAILDEAETATAAVVIVNDGGGTLTGLSAAIEYDAGAAGWLAATLTAASAPATLELAANAARLARGTYRASVRLTSPSVGATPVVVRVVFDVLQRTGAPTLVSVTPDRSAREQSLDVIMTGANFVPDLTTVSFGAGITVNDVDVEGPTTLTAAITVGTSAAVGTRNVTVTNPPPGGGSMTLADAFTVTAALSPGLSSVTAAPSSDVAADGTAVSTVTIVLRDVADSVVTGIDPSAFEISTTGSAVAGTVTETETAGTYVVKVSNTVAETISVTVTVEGVVLEDVPTIGFIAPSVSAANSSLSASPVASVTADGVASSVVTVVLRDSNDNPIRGLSATAFAITLSGSAAAGSISETATAGTYTFAVTSTVAGSVTVQVSAGGTALNQQPVIEFVPGAGSAANSSALVPGGVAGAVTAIEITVRDDAGNLVAGAAGLAVSVTGANTARPVVTDNGDGKYGATYTPTAAGVDQVAITLGGVAIAGSPFTSIVSASGISAARSGVTAAPATVVADGATASTVTIALRDAHGNAIGGVTGGDFAVAVTGSGTASAVAETATAGTYSFGVTNTVAEKVKVTVTAGGVKLDERPTIQFVAGAATQIAVNAGEGQSATVATAVAVAPSVIVRDANDNPVAGISVTFAVTDGGGSLDGSGTVDTDAAGIATSPQWTLGPTVGTNTLTATRAGLTGSPVTFTATGTPGAAAQMAITTQPSTTAATAVAFAQQPVIQLLDGAGNPAASAGVVVTAAIASGGGTLGGTVTAATDADGIAMFTDLSITGLVGERTLEFSASGVAPVTSNAISITAGPAARMVRGDGDDQSATVGTAVAVPPNVIVTDASGNPIGDVAVTFAVASGNGSLAASGAVTTNPSGVATSPAWTLGLVAGPNTLTATSNGLTGSPITFTATGTSADATRLTIAIQPSSSAPSGAAFAQQPAVRTHDSEGNVVAEAGVIVTAEIATGGGTLGGTLTATTNENGLATFTNLSITGLVGPRTLEFTSPGLALDVSDAVSITPGTATQIAADTGDNQSAAVGTEVPVAPSVIVRDAAGNPVAGVIVTFAIATGEGTLTGTNPVATGADGIATAPAWTLGPTPGENTMTATAAGVAGSVIFTATGVDLLLPSPT